MPLTTDLTAVTVAGVIDKASSLVKSVASQYITVDGCTSYSDSPNKGEIFLGDVKNAAQVKNPTGTYEFYLYAVSGGVEYPIAKQISGITISDITSGTLTSFTVSAVTTSTI